MAGKGHHRRPTQISREHETIRWQLAQGKITFEQYAVKYKKLKKEGKL